MHELNAKELMLLAILCLLVFAFGWSWGSVVARTQGAMADCAADALKLNAMAEDMNSSARCYCTVYN